MTHNDPLHPDLGTSPAFQSAGIEDDVLDRYLAKRASDTERATVEQIASRHPATRAFLDGIATRREIRDGTFDIATGRSAIARRITEREARVRRVRWARIGGSIGAVAAFASIAMFMVHRGDKQSEAHTDGQVIRYATGVGEQATINLRDGTRVTLAPQSTLQAFNGERGARSISLNGEASFEVVSSNRTPFIVHTGKVTTQVLGTVFDVRHYPTDSHVRIAVASGKVAVVAAGRRLTLAAGTVARATDSTAAERTFGPANQYMMWTRGELVFREAPLSDVLTTLTHWYGYRFVLSDSSLARETVTAGFSTRSSTAALATLKAVLSVELTAHDTTITLRPARSGRAVPRYRTPGAMMENPKTEMGR